MISKSMSYLLRHGALKEEVSIQPDGKMKIQDLLDWLNRDRKQATREDVMQVIREDNKSRYCYDPLEDLIWAAQGHSMDLQVDMELWTGSGFLIHASYVDCEISIKKEGLSRMSRRHIHMIDPNREASWDLLRKDANMYVIVDSNRARKVGIEFYQSDNGVVLTEGLNGKIPAKLLTIIHAPRKTGCYGFIVQTSGENRENRENRKTLMVRTETGHWGFPKGKRHKNEHSLQCALRELYEETGLKPCQLVLLPDTIEEINERGNCPTVYFQASVYRSAEQVLPDVKCLDKEEGLDVAWMSKWEIDQLSITEFVERRRILLDMGY